MSFFIVINSRKDIVISKLNYWSEEDIELLRSNFPILEKDELLQLFPTRSWSSILSKANKLDIHKRLLWSSNEDELLKKIYDKVPMNEVIKMFPNRTKEGIIHRAQKLELNSFDHPIWTNEQKEYLKEKWELYPDIKLAEDLHKTKNAIKRMRNLLGLHRQDKSQRTYENISKYIRGNIYQWKLDSMENCNYKCVLTGSKDFEIHHLYPVNKIINNIMIQNNIELKAFNDYTEKELNTILDLFLIEQSKYPLGECIRKDLHILFHSLYGQYNANIEQWEQFKKDYKNGLYDNYKKDIVA